MTTPNTVISKLENFLTKRKFTEYEFIKYDSTPYRPDRASVMESNINQCTQWLIDDVNNHHSSRRIKKSIVRGFNLFNRNEFTLKERKMIAEYFDDLSIFVNVNIDFAYFYFTLGWFNGIWLSIVSFFLPKKSFVDKFINTCSKCGTNLYTFTYQKASNDSEEIFAIVKCNICGEYNMIEIVSSIKEINHVYYEIEDQLSKKDFTLEQAKIRLEQIKNFRQ